MCCYDISERSGGVTSDVGCGGGISDEVEAKFNSKKSKPMVVGKCEGEWKINEERMWKYSSIFECGLVEG